MVLEFDFESSLEGSTEFIAAKGGGDEAGIAGVAVGLDGLVHLLDEFLVGICTGE